MGNRFEEIGELMWYELVEMVACDKTKESSVKTDVMGT